MFRGISAVVVGGAGISFVAAASLLLLYLAIPKTVSAFLALPERQLLSDIRAGSEIEAQALETLANSRRRASGWVDSGRIWSDLALAHLLMADVGKLSSKDRLSHLRQADGFLEASLRLAPANPHDWTRRAYVGMLLRGPSQTGASALVMSMLTARYEPDLMFARLQLCFISWRYFSLADQNLVFDQIRLAWRQSPDRVLDIARREDWTDILRAAFAHIPEFLADLEQRVAARQ
jgi:hypothetical protein